MDDLVREVVGAIDNALKSHPENNELGEHHGRPLTLRASGDARALVPCARCTDEPAT